MIEINPARNVICYSCGKTGHFGKVCRSKSTRTTSSLAMPQTVSSLSSHSLSLCLALAVCPGSLINSSISVNTNGKYHTASTDLESSESYVNYNVCKKLNLDIYPSLCEFQVGLYTIRMKSKGFCLADVSIKDAKYESIDLCGDVISELDFQSPHSRLIFEFGSTLLELVIQPNELSRILAAT